MTTAVSASYTIKRTILGGFFSANQQRRRGSDRKVGQTPSTCGGFRPGSGSFQWIYTLVYWLVPRTQSYSDQMTYMLPQDDQNYKPRKPVCPTSKLMKLIKIDTNVKSANNCYHRLVQGNMIVILENNMNVDDKGDQSVHSSYPHLTSSIDCRYVLPSVCVPYFRRLTLKHSEDGQVD
ncbi:Hypothetical predicted protein [Scomber scombrus]|uniref:Uncharacterized protein n=1 Tax=Scomber scombrus TaxID=13677 RepID=A0AAV1MTU7_SCOSC